MTTEERVLDEATAHEAFAELVKIERAIDNLYQEIAVSLGLKDRKAVGRHIESLKGDVKQYLVEQGGSLHDGEFDWTARLQSRSNVTYDLVTAAQTEDGPRDLAEAARAGMLKLDNRALEHFRGSAGAPWADRLYRYRMPTGATSALIIERGGR